MARTRKNAALDYQALRTQLRDGRYESLYVIYGDERFLIEKLISAFDQQLIERAAASLTVLFCMATDSRGALNSSACGRKCRRRRFFPGASWSLSGTAAGSRPAESGLIRLMMRMTRIQAEPRGIVRVV
jgi:hypothetical protein